MGHTRLNRLRAIDTCAGAPSSPPSHDLVPEISKGPTANVLVKLAARAFYDDITTKGENQPKNGRSDNRGIAVVVLDALARRQWVREEDLAKDLKLHSKQLRRTLRFFEEEKLVTRDHRREVSIKLVSEQFRLGMVASRADRKMDGRLEFLEKDVGVLKSDVGVLKGVV
ncbi:hypothetical protein L484_022297 [Morus notabilis]|uniref:HTH TFE/IIEalpha-type domain-containing protein n=1 Tax=Morus notabilis TaxID=981085 RepID=W9S6C0_9ROSA|nr:hypothetical protein L484_022297 [Morus notabilis]